MGFESLWGLVVVVFWVCLYAPFCFQFLGVLGGSGDWVQQELEVFGDLRAEAQPERACVYLYEFL